MPRTRDRLLLRTIADAACPTTSRSAMRPYHAFLTAALAAATPAQAVIVAVPASRDATLYEDPGGALANDRGQSIFVGRNAFAEARRAVLAFDVQAAVPQGAQVVEAQLLLDVVQAVALGPTPVFVHRLTAAWTEGTSVASGPGGAGTQAQPGDTTWVYREYPTTRWAALGGDFEAQPCATGLMPVFGPFSIQGPGLLADVRALAAGAANHGFLLKTDELGVQDARRLHSQQSPQAGQRPVLRITFVPPGRSGDFGVGCAGPGKQALQQTLLGAPVRGGAATVQVSQGSPQSPTLTLVGLSLAPEPLLAQPGCAYYLDMFPWTLIGPATLDAQGQRSDTFAIPQESWLLGLSLSLQTVAYDPANPPSLLAFSNATLVVIG